MMCSSWVSFWYCSETRFFFLACGDSCAPSVPIASLTRSPRGFLWLPLTGLGFGLTFFAFGGVSARRDSSSKASGSPAEPSSSESSLERFLGTVLLGLGPAFALGAMAFFEAGFASADFLTALGLAF